jgi:hypothetical protein
MTTRVNIRLQYSELQLMLSGIAMHSAINFKPIMHNYHQSNPYLTISQSRSHNKISTYPDSQTSRGK